MDNQQNSLEDSFKRMFEGTSSPLTDAANSAKNNYDELLAKNKQTQAYKEKLEEALKTLSPEEKEYALRHNFKLYEIKDIEKLKFEYLKHTRQNASKQFSFIERVKIGLTLIFKDKIHPILQEDINKRTERVLLAEAARSDYALLQQATLGKWEPIEFRSILDVLEENGVELSEEKRKMYEEKYGKARKAELKSTSMERELDKSIQKLTSPTIVETITLGTQKTKPKKAPVKKAPAKKTAKKQAVKTKRGPKRTN